MSWVRQALRILVKDLQIEWRGRARGVALFAFAGLMILLVNHAWPSELDAEEDQAA